MGKHNITWRNIFLLLLLCNILRMRIKLLKDNSLIVLVIV
jgi:hypothetical protein